MKVLIVDDEMLVRVGIKSSIDWDKYEMKVVGEASNGEEALKLIKELAPDVVLLDIKMPVMDGIELMKIIKTEGIRCKVVILSSFNDFIYVKEAMKLGAIDYFHKPAMKPEDIFSVLMHIKQKLEPVDIKHNTNFKDKFLIDLFDGVEYIDTDLENKIREFNLSITKANARCIIFSVLNFNEVQKRYINSNKNIFENYLENIVLEILSSEKETEFVKYNKNIYVLIKTHNSHLGESEIYKEDNLLIGTIQSAMKQFLNVDIIVGVSDITHSINNISQIFKQAYDALKYNFFSKDRIITYYYQIDKKIDAELTKELDLIIENAKICLLEKAYTEFIAMLEEIVNLTRVSMCLSEAEIKKLFMGLLFMCDKGKSWLLETEQMANCYSIDKLLDVFKSFINEKYIANQSDEVIKNASSLIKEVITYVNQNYNAEITLGILCDKFNISYSYLSRQFNKYIGKSLYNYVNGIRIEKAKKLLKDPKLKIYEIADKIGFKSTVHFNIVFNKAMGISPKEYRENG